MNCPYCDTVMEAGHLEVHGTVLGFMFVGWSHQNCYFRRGDGTEEVVVKPRHGMFSRPKREEWRPKAHRCEKCGCVVVEGARRENSTIR